MSSPIVSVIVPCRNHGEFLSEAIESVQVQTFRDFEIVIVDDGSDDSKTLELLARGSWPKTRVLRTERAGVAHARNLGIRESSGGYLSFFDSDDRMHPKFLERTVSVLNHDPSLAFVSCWVRLFGDESWEWKPEHCEFPWLLHECTVATAALVRRSALSEVGGFDPRFELGHEDWELWTSLVELGQRGMIVPEVLFSYRRSADSRSSVADRSATYLELYRDRLRKHRDAYQRYFFDVLWLKEQTEIGRHFAAIATTRERIEAALEPSVARLRERVEAAFVRKFRDDN